MLIFKDKLISEGATPPYYFQSLIDGEWTTIHTVTGESTGTVEVNEVSNQIKVNTDLFKQGETYDFRWIDDNGTESNIISLLIPTT